MKKFIKAIIDGMPALKRATRTDFDPVADYARKPKRHSTVAVLRELMTPKVLLAYSGLFLIGFGSVSIALKGII